MVVWWNDHFWKMNVVVVVVVSVDTPWSWFDPMPVRLSRCTFDRRLEKSWYSIDRQPVGHPNRSGT